MLKVKINSRTTAPIMREFYRYPENHENVPAIVLGCHKIGLGVIRALGIKGVPVIGAYYKEMDMGYVSKYLIQKYKVSDPEEDEEKFIEDLVRISEKFKGAVLFTSDDPTLLAVSRNKDFLKDYFIVEAPDYELLKIIIDKRYTYKLADEIGVLAPKTYNPKNFTEARSLAQKLDYPFILKPAVGHLFYNIYRKKMIFIRDESDLKRAYDQINGVDISMMIQEFIPGDDTNGVNYNSFFLEGKAIVQFSAEKVRLSPPKIGFPRVIVSKRNEEVSEPGIKILRALNYNGFSCIEFKKHQLTGKYVLMEINGRQNLSTPLAVKCGYNFPYITYRWLIDGSLPIITDSYAEGIYWIDPGKDIIESIKSFTREGFSIVDYFRPYFGRKVFTIPDKKDIRPLFKRVFDGIGLLPRMLRKKVL